MLKKSTLALSALLYAQPCLAQPDMNQTTEAIGQIINQTTEQLTNVIQEAVPEITNKMEDFMKAMMQSMAPFILAVEENKKLPAATPEMAEAIKSAIGYKYTQNTELKIDDKFNALELKGTYTEADTTLYFRTNRFLPVTTINNAMLKEASVINLPNGEDAEQKEHIITMNNEKIDSKLFKLSEINGLPVLIYDNEEKKESYIITNIGAYLSLEVQSTGPRYKELLLEFFGTINQNALKSAVQDDGRNLDDIQAELKKKAEDPATLQKVFDKFQDINGAK